MSKWFISGTDTDVGKTSLATSLLMAARAIGRTAIGYKAIETGCTNTTFGPDTQRLAAATGNQPECSYSFEAPVAPSQAAEVTGTKIRIQNIVDHAAHLATRYDVLLVEGAGGLLVPINDKETIADLAILCKLPMLLVAPNRIGSINHTLLSIEAAAHRNILIDAIVLSDICENPSDYLGNVSQIQKHGQLPVLRLRYCQSNDELMREGKRLLSLLLTNTKP